MIVKRTRTVTDYYIDVPVGPGVYDEVEVPGFGLHKLDRTIVMPYAGVIRIPVSIS